MSKKTLLPKVTVCVMTYNHHKYIAKCLESILAQEGEFSLEIIVADDCSKDGTQEIIKSFQKKYPLIVKPMLQEENIGVSANFMNLHASASGEYVCHCDGDDFWFSGKVAYQLSKFLKNNRLVQVWHCARTVNDTNEPTGIFPSNFARIFYPVKLNAEDIALSYALVGHHSTHMYRRVSRVIPKTEGDILDYWIAFNISLQGESYYSKKILSAYRVVSANSVTTNQGKKRATVDALSNHLFYIYKNLPQYRAQTIANINVRRFFSLVKKHDLTLIDEYKEKMNGELKVLLFIKAAYYFLLQKIY